MYGHQMPTVFLSGGFCEPLLWEHISDLSLGGR
jgi:hypothetical protein